MTKEEFLQLKYILPLQVSLHYFDGMRFVKRKKISTITKHIIKLIFGFIFFLIELKGIFNIFTKPTANY